MQRILLGATTRTMISTVLTKPTGIIAASLSHTRKRVLNVPSGMVLRFFPRPSLCLISTEQEGSTTYQWSNPDDGFVSAS